MLISGWVRVLLTAVSALAAPGLAATLQGEVLRVIDGDSLIVLADAGGEPLEVRLHGIDAPEGCQAGGPEAKGALEAFVAGKPVTLDTRRRDSYGRTLARLSVDGVDVNRRLVAEGHAWTLRNRRNQGPYMQQERVAQALRRGLHATPGAELPSQFRRRHGPCGRAPQRDEPAAAVPAAPADPALAFRCDGRTRCSQMRSCAEATYFLRHCPGVEMDGNRDGVPCERQWCR